MSLWLVSFLLVAEVLSVIAEVLAGPKALLIPPHATYIRLQGGILLPDPTYTPGATRTVSFEELCRKGSAREARLDDPVTRAMADAIYARYGQHRIPGRCCESDHLIPLWLGGATVLENLWPQPWDQARKKDRVEYWLHEQVCAQGKDALAPAQHRISHNWWALYQEMPDDRKD
jgi:hypothetical protein